ncbi:hypothetical protein OUZ56_021799 [Daphnia magna]|uniref:Uncharacterized protein n=1 Tax=Daphnia magna TaxID=35525 RepID=A0ABR0AUH7_9CRUS|nr:hypothetical protein OUZ56_021799 [Daphnia magna]
MTRTWRGILGPFTEHPPALGIAESVPFLLYRDLAVMRNISHIFRNIRCLWWVATKTKVHLPCFREPCKRMDRNHQQLSIHNSFFSQL